MFPWYMFVGLLGNKDKNRDTDLCSDFYYERKRERWSLRRFVSNMLFEVSLYIRMPIRKLKNWCRHRKHEKKRYSYLKSKRINFRDSKYANAKAFLKNFHDFRCCKFDQEFITNKQEIARLKKPFLKINKVLKMQMIDELTHTNAKILINKMGLSLNEYIKNNNIYDAAEQLEPLISYVEEKQLPSVAFDIWLCSVDYIRFGKYKDEMLRLIYEVGDGTLKKTSECLSKNKGKEMPL